jgi:hypothetical protein
MPNMDQPVWFGLEHLDLVLLSLSILCFVGADFENKIF